MYKYKYQDQFIGKTCIVTGGGKGIGQMTALEMGLNCGANVVVVDLDEATAKATADQINQGGGTAIGIGCDVSHEEPIKELINKVVATYGGLHYIASTVARTAVSWTERDRNFDYDEQYVLDTFSTNLCGGIFLIKHGAPAIAESGGGAICCVSSVAALGATPIETCYGFTKAALENMVTDAARMYGKQGVRVNAVRPYATITPALVETWGTENIGIQEKYTIMNPKFTDGSGIATVISFLLSNDSYTIQGATLPTDNGYGAMGVGSAIGSYLDGKAEGAQN